MKVLLREEDPKTQLRLLSPGPLQENEKTMDGKMFVKKVQQKSSILMGPVG